MAVRMCDDLEALVEKARTGDRDGLERLVEQIQRPVYNLALRMLWHPADARDATQDILIRVVTHLGTFRGDSRVLTWVFRVAANYLITARQSRVEAEGYTFDRFANELHDGLGDVPDEGEWTDAFIPTLDADNHFAGGLRLPHVESEIHGRVAGAPLGRHTPVNPLGVGPFEFIGGTFTRFNDAELLVRYSSRFQYVKRVRRAADHLAARGYITDKDRKALVAAAKEEPLPCGPEDDDGNDLQREAGCPQSPLTTSR
jgi:RNA polymerase sigma factor (sigma-70 family)